MISAVLPGAPSVPCGFTEEDHTLCTSLCSRRTDTCWESVSLYVNRSGHNLRFLLSSQAPGWRLEPDLWEPSWLAAGPAQYTRSIRQPHTSELVKPAGRRWFRAVLNCLCAWTRKALPDLNFVPHTWILPSSGSLLLSAGAVNAGWHAFENKDTPLLTYSLANVFYIHLSYSQDCCPPQCYLYLVLQVQFAWYVWLVYRFF